MADLSPQPHAFTGKRKAAFLTLVAQTGSIRGAASRAGVARATVYDHAEKDPEFREAIERAVAECEQSLVNRIIAAAETGKVIERRGTTVTEPGDWRAAAWLLEHGPYFRDRYAGILKQKVELGGSEDMPAIEVHSTTTQQLEVGPETLERLQIVVGVLLRAGKLRLPDPGEVIDGESEPT